VSRATVQRIVLALAGVAAGAALMVAVLSLVNGDAGFAFCTATGRFGWLVPLVAGLVIGAVSLSLLSDPEGHSALFERDAAPQTMCASCGSPVIEGSRLCPSCGRLIGRDGVLVEHSPFSGVV